MVAWSWSEFALNGIKDSPKNEAEILIKMFHINHVFDSLLFDKTQMDGIYCIVIFFLFFICVMPSILASSRRNSAGSHLSCLRKVSKRR